MKTRIFKALNDATEEKFLRIVNKIAVYDDNGKQVDCQEIIPSQDGVDYYFPHNPHDEYGLFLGKVKDAIETIRNGYGDKINRGVTFPYGVSVIRYINRDIGDYIRERTLRIYSDTKFAYTIRIYSPSSTFFGSVITRQGLICPLIGHDCESIKPYIFTTENEANDFVNTLKSRINDMNDDYEMHGSYQRIVEDHCFDKYHPNPMDNINVLLFSIWKKLRFGSMRLKIIQWIV